jgi:tetratricopeptide (TPR) repeat protein
MRNDRFRQEREEIKELLTLYNNLRDGLTNSFIEKEGFERIIEHFDERDKIDEALEVCGFAINQYPNTTSLLLLKANLLIVKKKYRSAMHLLEQVGHIDTTDFNLYILKTDTYLALDMQEKAAEVLEAALDNFEGDEKIELLLELTDVYDDYENFEKVFDCLVIILTQDPANEEALYKICFWAEFTGRNEESIKLHKQIIDEQPYNELAWFNLAAAYQGIKLYEKAIDAYGYVIAINEKFENAYRNIGDACIRLRNFKEAIENLQKVLELAPPDPIIYEAIGYCFDKQSNFAQARFYYKKASHLSIDDSRLHFKIGTTYMNEGQWESAIKSLNNALGIHPNQAEYNISLGKCYSMLNDFENALTYFGNVVKLKPKNINGWKELLKCLYLGSFIAEGVEYSQYAYEQTDGKPIFLFFKSLFLFANGKHKEASLVLENAMQLNPKLIKTIIQINPSLLKHKQVIDILARNKRKD